MKMNVRRMMMMTALGLMVLFTSCGSDDGGGGSIPISLSFTNTELGLTESVQVEIALSRPAESDGAIMVTIGDSGLDYGQDADYYVDPDVADGEVAITFEEGDETILFMVYAGSALNIAEDETITLTITSSESFDLGENTSVTITISENFLSTGGTLEINGGGEEFPNQVFLDLSKLTQTTVDKYSWDLGFYAEAGEHYVVLNSSAYVMAQALDGETDIDAVTAADTTGFGAQMYLSNYVDTEATNWIDDQSGDLDQTAFGAISATNDNNLVFIIKRDGEGRDWKKVRVLQDGDNYTLQYADINATSHTEVTISKDGDYNFTHFDLENGVVEVEPEKTKWDLMYSTYSGKANFGVFYAIGYNDYIVSNREGVSVATISESDIAYDNFTSTDVEADDMVSDNISTIGSSWRGLVDFSLVLDEDVYYIISDGENNTYKLKFTRLSSEDGERGYPEFKYELL